MKHIKIFEKDTNYLNPEQIRIERAEGKNSGETVYSFIHMGKPIALSVEQRTKIEEILNKK